jgi:hypothetical protein
MVGDYDGNPSVTETDYTEPEEVQAAVCTEPQTEIPNAQL